MRCLYNNSTSQYIALAYGNEKAVGDAIKESGIPHEEFFIATKLRI
ncbi:MAG TPA: hypothetical protein PLM56_04690 [Cyclobacteriaceae bacterium]|nr:hypothetical protein [Cyclobacteriaceae bacterium]HRF32771.1 hypothetical protein [Cyclobacteriaceae bacterium]